MSGKYIWPDFQRAMVLKKSSNPHDLLERMLNRTQLTTQRLHHKNILEVGDQVMEAMNATDGGEAERKMAQKLDEVRQRAARELQFALQRQRRELDRRQREALERQEKFFKDQAARVERQRDALEEQRLEDQRRDLEAEHAEAMQQAEIRYGERLKKATAESERRLRREIGDEMERKKQRELDQLMREAEESYQRKLKTRIHETEEKCRTEAADEARRVATRHSQEVATLVTKLNLLKEEFSKEHKHRLIVEKDFRDLQHDYKRFLDLTDGQFHSDYIMQLRSHGFQIADKTVKQVLTQDLSQLDHEANEEATDLVRSALRLKRVQSAKP